MLVKRRPPIRPYPHPALQQLNLLSNSGKDMSERSGDDATDAGVRMAELVLQLSQQLSRMNWPPKVLEAFSREQMVFLGDLCTSNADVLSRNPGIGRKTIENLRASLRLEKLDLNMNLPWWDALREQLAADAPNSRTSTSRHILTIMRRALSRS